MSTQLNLTIPKSVAKKQREIMQEIWADREKHEKGVATQLRFSSRPLPPGKVDLSLFAY